jgi:hypothetical protein
MANATVATYPGRGIIWNRMKGVGAEARNIGWGTTAITGSASANVNLFGPQTEGRVTGVSTILTTTQLGDTYQVTGTIVCLVGSKSIQEAGLFDALTPSSPTTTLAASLAIGATSVTLGSSLSGANGTYYAQLENETVLVVGAASTTLTVTRAALGTASAVHANGVPITMGGDGGSNTTSGGWTGSPQTVNATSMTGLYGGNLFIHADFASISLNVNDSISFTFSDTLTGWLVMGLTSAISAALGLSFLFT